MRIVAVLALGLASVVLCAPWSNAPRAQAPGRGDQPERRARRRGLPHRRAGGIIYGQSMGGHIVVASLELKPGLYQGGLAECGLVDGISIADYLTAYTAAAELIAGVPLLDAPDRQTFARILNERVVPALGLPGSHTARDDNSTAS
jgi:hypothetical protein